jgi:hypothetical protein
MTDVHETYVERRRWRIWPIVVLILVALFAIGLLIAMIMNIHGSITWPAGEVKFGFWPPTETIAVAPAQRVPTAPSPAASAPASQVEQVQGAGQVEQVQGGAPPIRQAQPSTSESIPIAPPPSESSTAPQESAPAPLQ